MSVDDDPRHGPHAGQPVLFEGSPLESARSVAVLVHGRGATAHDMLTLAPHLGSSGMAILAPQAEGNSWYPQSFLAPIATNEPWLSSALETVGMVVQRIKAARVPMERVLLLGFSQGACLTLEYVARHAQRYGGVAGLSGGLIGPDGTARDYTGSLAGTPVFLGCSDVDPHIPAARVEESAEILRRLGGDVTAKLYPGMGHTVNDDELEVVREIVTRMQRTF